MQTGNGDAISHDVKSTDYRQRLDYLAPIRLHQIECELSFRVTNSQLLQRW